MDSLTDKRTIRAAVCLFFLALIVYIGFWVRSTNVPNTVADYDPHWYYRHSLDALNYGLNLPKWDILSYYPPGRPYEAHEGLEYTLAFSYEALGRLVFPTFLKFFILAPAIIAGLSAIPAYIATNYMGRSRLGGLFAAFFAVLVPSFISYSVSGYMDSKVLVVFYSFLSIYSLMLFMKDRKIWSFLLATVVNLLFIYTWATGGWYPLMAFTALLPAVFVFRIVEQMIHRRAFKFDMKPVADEVKSLLIPFLMVMVAVNVVTQIFLSENIVQSILAAAGFAGLGQALLVNISVAELQPINILSLQGFLRVAGTVGMLPVALTLFGLPLLVLFKLWKKDKIAMEEIFLVLFALATFYMILRGTRFALIFSVATSLSAGYFIANVYRYIKPFGSLALAAFLAVMVVGSIYLLSDAFLVGRGASQGYEVGQNWLDGLSWLKANGNSSTLVVTWWDPGHIITDLTGLKVMADGAHCGSACVPYNLDIRIQDMGRVFSISNETEALNILKKYTYLTPEQCSEVRQQFGSIVPANACDPVKKVYLIASSDLIGKYYWLTYFGTGTGRNYMQCSLDQQLSQQMGAYSYGCAAGIPIAISLVQKNNTVTSLMNSPQQGIRNGVIKNTMLFQNGVPMVFESGTGNTIDGLTFVDPSLRTVLFMDAQTRDSLFTNMFFFDGAGNTYLGIPALSRFKLAYQNQEVKIFEVDFQ